MNRFALLVVFVIHSAGVSTALADHKPGEYTGMRKCTGSAAGIDVDVTSRRTVGVATCKMELQKKFIAKGVCVGHKKADKIEYAYTFGGDRDPNQAKGTYYVRCP